MYISLIIPSYMGAKYIPNIVSSLKLQTDKNFEVVFILDSAKGDESIEFLQKLKEDSDIKVQILFNSKRQKRLFSIFEGIKIARGNYISICSTKDIITSNYIRKINSIILKNKPDIIEHKFRYYKSKIIPQLLTKKNKLINLKKNFFPIANTIPFDFNKIIRTTIAKKTWKTVYIDGGSRFDVSFTFNVMQLAKTYYAINDELKITKVLPSSLINHRSTIKAIKSTWNKCQFMGNEEFINTFAFQGWSAISIYLAQVLLVAKKYTVFSNLYNSLEKITNIKTFRHIYIHNKYFDPNLLATQLLKSLPNIHSYKKIIKKGEL